MLIKKHEHTHFHTRMVKYKQTTEKGLEQSVTNCTHHSVRQVSETASYSRPWYSKQTSNWCLQNFGLFLTRTTITYKINFLCRQERFVKNYVIICNGHVRGLAQCFLWWVSRFKFHNCTIQAINLFTTLSNRTNLTVPRFLLPWHLHQS